MPLNLEQFRKVVDRDQRLLAEGKAPEGVQTCACCGVPLQGSVTGRHLVRDRRTAGERR